MKQNVLDKGFVEVIDKRLNSRQFCRVSFGKRKEKFTDGDRKLVRYLGKYKHFSPFRHIQVQFHIKHLSL